MRKEYILQEHKKLPLKEQIAVLFKALDFMHKDHKKSKAVCIGLAMNIPEDPQIISIEKIEDYNVSVIFDNQENRVIHFRQVFDGSKKFHSELLNNYNKFKEIEVAEGTLAWKNLGVWTKDLNGKAVFDYFDIDPGLLYECSSPIGFLEPRK